MNLKFIISKCDFTKRFAASSAELDIKWPFHCEKVERNVKKIERIENYMLEHTMEIWLNVRCL